MTLHPFNQRILAEDLVRVRRPDDLERYAASQRQARIDPNPHQIDAVIFALRRLREGGCILADEVGLGKTIEAGLVIAQSRAEGAKRILLIVPKSLIGQWQNELANLFAIQAQDDERSYITPGVYLVGREFAGSDRGASALSAVPPFDLVVIDEAHEIFAGLHKRYSREGDYDESSDQALMAHRVRGFLRSSPVLLLTATPNLLEQAEIQLKEAEEAARHESANPALNDTVLRQELELRKSGAERAALLAQQRIDSITQAQQTVDAAADAERECLTQDEVVRRAKEASSDAEVKERASREQLLHCDVLERALDLRFAEKQLADAQGGVQKKEGIQASIDLVSAEHARLVSQRTAMKLPQSAALAQMRRLESDLAKARGALDVGFVVKVNAIEHVDLQVQKDGHTIEPIPANGPLELEAVREVDIRVSDIATIQVRGGRVDAQDRVRVLEARWSVEVVPHLAAAAVSNLEGLQEKLDEAVELDAQIKDKNTERTSLQVQIDSLSQSAEALEQATSHVMQCRQALGDASVESLASDLHTLGADPLQELRKRRLQASQNVDAERASAAEATKLATIAQERAANLRVAFNTAVEKRDCALQNFPKGLDDALSEAQQSLANAAAEKEKTAAELTALEQTIASRKKSIDTTVVAAKQQVENANSAVTEKGRELNDALERRAEHAGRLSQLQRQRDSEDLQAAELALLEATARHHSLPVPDRHVNADELVSAKNHKEYATSQLETDERELQRAHGALEQVGGAVARERLRDASDALELAERFERETEADYEAWKLLLEQMKEADSAQASNLGQSLAPAIANLFQTLTQRRYESIQLTAQLGTEGVVLAGMTRPADRLSVGTREQLSTLYRLALAEYLRATVVLDDQLVQSDESRMEWFRSLLTEKAGVFQIIVFTCRPNDYLFTPGYSQTLVRLRPN